MRPNPEGLDSQLGCAATTPLPAGETMIVDDKGPLPVPSSSRRLAIFILAPCEPMGLLLAGEPWSNNGGIDRPCEASVTDAL
jgi:hypothetical protein